MSSRCKSVLNVASVHSAREVLWDVMRTRHDLKTVGYFHSFAFGARLLE